jgi:ribosomal protein S18 acetylase RimI-like enzyme
VRWNVRDGRDMPIRKFERGDVAELTEIVRATKVFRDEEVDVAVELMEIAANDKDQKEYFLYSYVDDSGKLQGYYCVGPTPLTQTTFDLYWIAVHPSVQRKKIGNELLRHCEEQVQNMGGKVLVVETSSQQKYEPTRKFYLRQHYTEEACIKDYYAEGDDLIIFTKHFKER